ncbi:MAG TPA: AMP-binding protein [Prosthecobacter sp.]|nr:AMP-binding protein [Prosthecobacter sp.]
MLPLHAHPSWSTTPPEVWHAWQLRRLRDYLSERVLPFSAHYRRVFTEHDLHPEDLKSLEDWTLAPFTSKSDLTVPREQQREFVLIPEQAALRREWKTIRHALLHGRASAKEALEHEFRPVLLTSTTGRSSDPVPFLFTKHDLANMEITGRRLMEAGRSQKDFRHVNAFPFAPHLAFWQAHYAGIGFGTFMVSTGGGKSLGTEGNINLIEKIQPDVIIGMPTFMYHLLREAVEEGRRWPNIKRVVLGGEKVAEGLRARLLALTSALGSKDVCILSTYGFTEAKLAFPECANESGATSGFHLSPDLGIVELVDPASGRTVGDGEPGEIVFTPLDARGTVVLRYRTGDIAEGGLTWKRCPHCGRTCPRLLGPISRVSEVRELHLDKVKGALVNFNILEHLLDDQKGIAAWQIELNKRDHDPLEVDEVILHVTPDNGVESNELEHRIARRFSEVCEIKPNKSLFHDMADMRERLGVGRLLKEQKLIDLRKQPSSQHLTNH